MEFSIDLPSDDIAHLDRIGALCGLDRSSVVSMAIRWLHEQEETHGPNFAEVLGLTDP